MKTKALLLLIPAVLISTIALAESRPAFQKSSSQATAASGVTRAMGAEPVELKRDEAWPEPVDDETTHTFLLSEILEYRLNKGADGARWDIYGWHGGDYNRLWVKSEGGASTNQSSGEADFQLPYGRLISRYFDFQAGLRYEQIWSADDSDRSRTFAAIGVQGLAPYYFDVEPTLFVSQDGDVSARFTSTYDILLSQRLILQPRIESTAAVQENEKFGVGSGLNNAELGIRLRYELMREFAPYVGINFGRQFGGTADIARVEGKDTRVVAGIWSSDLVLDFQYQKGL